MSAALPARSPARAAADGAVVAGAAGLAALVAESLGKLPFNSDQALIGLMALDIAERGRHPVFCYGSEYGGTAEAHGLALVFGVFGASPAVFRVAMVLLTIGIAVTMWRLGYAAFGKRASLYAGLYPALGPSYLLYKSLTSDGDYASLLLFSGCALLAFLAAMRGIRVHGRAPAAMAVFGLLCGLAWWTLPLSLSLFLACGAAALLAARARIRAADLASAAAGAIAGAAPWLVHNARSGWASLRAPEMALVDPRGFLTGLRDLFRFGWTICLGGWHVGTWGVPPWPVVILCAAFLAVLLVWGVAAARREEDPDRRLARILLLAMAIAPAALGLLARRTDFREPRYLLLCYLGIAPLAGGLLQACRRRAAPLAVLLVLLFVLGPLNQLTAPTMRRFELSEFRDDVGDLAGRLEELGVTEVYASYWVAYRLSFVTGLRVGATPFGNGSSGFVRSADLARRVDAVPSPDFLLYGEDLDAFASFLAHRPVPHAEERLGNFRLYRHLPADLVTRLRETRSIPFWMQPGDVVWRAAEGPDRIPSGDAASFTVSLANRWCRRIPENVHLSYHWERRDGTVVVFDGVRTSLPPQYSENHRRITIRATVLANVPPGDYRVRFGLVHEGWFWLSEMGIRGPAVEVRVTPPAPR